MIVCCGEALIDMLPRKLPDGTDVFLPVSGGAIFNTAIALGRLGSDIGFFSGISTDMFGEQLVKSLSASNVDINFVRRLDHPTTMAFVKLVDGHAEYSFYDENTAGRLLEVQHLPDFNDSVTALHFGAISLIPEPCGHAYESLMAKEHTKRVISFDPNIRPGFITDEQKYRARINRMLAMADIIKVSDEDLKWLEPDLDADDVAKKWLDAGAAIILITKGSKGARAISSSHVVDVPSRKVEVVDTVGAGDSFNAGFLHSLSTSGALDKRALKYLLLKTVEAALNLASDVAAATVSKAGTDSPWFRDL